MHLPGRVPWASITELDEVCSWIFQDENDIEKKTLAVHRLSAWKAITTLPHALESTLALLTIILQDNSEQSPSSCLCLRQSYAAAILRLVNGLVDPLQLGAYARSIASIASQLGLPSWLVELRHAATHEDLPSLELLREAATESMSWLFHNYFLPTLNPLTALRSQPTLRPLAPLLKQYKSLLKLTTRDASLSTQYQPAIDRVVRDVERWVAETKVAANVGLGWDADEGGTSERWALDKLCDALLEKGILVPLSKKKRIFPTNSFSPPKTSLQLWTPLLLRLRSRHNDLPSTLINRIVSHLLPDRRLLDGNATIGTSRRDDSFDMCIARWAWWIVQSWNVVDDETDFNLKKDTIIMLITALGPETTANENAAKALLRALCTGNSELEAKLQILLPQSRHFPSHEWTANDMPVMQQRLNSLQSIGFDNQPTGSLPQQPRNAILSDHGLPPGWQLLDDSRWKPCPVGIYVDVVY